MSTTDNNTTAYDRAHDPAFNPAGVSAGVDEMPSGVLTQKLGTENKPFELRVSPVPFESTTEAKLLTTLDLGAMINALFKKVFKDYDGCTLVLDPNQNRWKARLFFRENVNVSTDGAVKNIIPLSTKADRSNGRPSIGQRLESVSMITSNVHYKLSTETTDVLTKYYMPWEKNGKGEVNWKFFLSEQSEQIQYGVGGTAIYVCVSGVDVVELLKSIYGAKNEEDHWVDYSVTAIRPVTQFQPSTPNLLLSIQRIDCEYVKDLYQKIAGVPTYGRIPIIR